MLVGVANDPGDAGQGRYFAGSALRVTAGDQYLGVGVLPIGAADSGASVLVSGSCYRAGIQYHEIGLGGTVDLLQALFLKSTRDGSTVGLCGPTTEAL